MPAHVAFSTIARPLIVFHTLAAMVLAGSATHAAVVAIGALRGHARARLARIYAVIVAAAYVTTMVLGALAYPTYRYLVRGLYFDRYAPWASNLFDIKENFAVLGLPLACGALLLRCWAAPEGDRRLLGLYSVLVLGTALIVWFAMISGIVIVLEKAP